MSTPVATGLGPSSGPAATLRAAPARRADHLAGLIFLGPAMLLFLVFVLGPFVVAIGLSLFRWDMLTPPEFIGVENLLTLATDASFYNALRNKIGRASCRERV